MYFNETAKGFSSKLKDLFKNIKMFDQICLSHSTTLIQCIFWIKILGWKASY